MKQLLMHTFLRRKLFLPLLPLLLALACGSGSSGGVASLPTDPPLPTVTAIVAAEPTATPKPGQTGASQSDTLGLPTPETSTPDTSGVTPTLTAPDDDTPTATLEPSPTPIAVAASAGMMTGQVTYRSQSDDMLPDTAATVQLVSYISSGYFSANTDGEGRYTLAGIPPGSYFALARSSVGSSNPQEVQINDGEIATVDFVMFTGQPYIYNPRPAGGHVLIDGQPVAGAQVWRFGGLIESDSLAVTDASGYFSFPYFNDTPVIAVSGDRWTMTTLQTDAVINIELDRTGPHPTPPNGPVVTPVPVEVDVIIDVATRTPTLGKRPIYEFEIIKPAPSIGVQPVRPAPDTDAPVQVAPAEPAPQPTLAPTGLPPIPTACGQSKANVDYGPLRVGSTVILGRHESVNGTDIWEQDMDNYVKQKATITGLDGVDKVGCPVVRVDIDKGRWQWRIRALTLVKP